MKSISLVHRCGHIVLVVLLVLFSHPTLAATIVVDETTCTLVDAITAANTDSPVGGCAAGSGPDTIELTTDVTLTMVNNDNFVTGTNGLPVVASEIAVEGGGFTIERDVDAPPFRLIHVFSSGTITLNELTLRNGSASGGGAILNYYGTTTLTNSTVSGNSADIGGGIFSAYGTTTLTNSTVSGNSAEYGGGIFSAYGTTTLTNSTVSGNSADFGGGGIFSAYGTTTLTNSTVSGNSSSSGVGGIFNFVPDGSIVIANSIVADNNENCDGDITDNGNNFADDDTCGAGFADIAPAFDFDTNLADNGGPTLTHALLPGSVAIDAAGACGLATDQRGFPRDRFACDSGSVEFQGGADTPATSSLGLLVLLAILMTVSWAILRPKWGARHPR